MSDGHYRTVINGRLVAVTATGPIYRGKADLAIVPVSVGLALIQELAARTIRPNARVVSSLANRVNGDAARSVWAHVSGCACSTLADASPRARLTFLSRVLTYAHRQGNANGIEPVLGAAVNAAWPWMDSVTLDKVLTLTSKYFRKSEFAAASTIPIIDINSRTLTLFEPGALGKVDPQVWLDWKALNPPEFGNRGGSDPSDLGLLPGRGPDLSGLPGRGRGSDPVGDSGLLPGRGPDLSGLPGRGRGSDPVGDSGLLPGRGPDLSGLPGRGRGSDPVGDSGLLPGRGPGLGNLGGNGGPYGYGSTLGQGGAATPLDEEKSRAKSQRFKGGVQVTVGAGIAIFGAAQVLLSGGTSPTGWAALAIGSFVGGWGWSNIEVGTERAADAALRTPGPAPEPAPPPPPPPEPGPEPEPKPEPTEIPVEPRHGDLYPDPDGTGGGGNPTQLPVGDDTGGGNRPPYSAARIQLRSGMKMEGAGPQIRYGMRTAAAEHQRPQPIL